MMPHWAMRVVENVAVVLHKAVREGIRALPSCQLRGEAPTCAR